MVSPELLRRYPFFGSLSDSQIKSMAMIAEEESVAKGTVLCEEGQPENVFFLLLEGSASLYYKSGDEFHPKALNSLIVKDLRLYSKLMREVIKAAMERLGFARVQLAAAWAK